MANSTKTTKTTKTSKTTKSTKTTRAPRRRETAPKISPAEMREVEIRDLKAKLDSYLANVMHTTFERATAEEIYKGVANVVNSRLADMRVSFNHKRIANHRHTDDTKKIYYICMEFLLGQSLKNHLSNLGGMGIVKEVLAERDMTLEELFECEPDAGLGNGGLGRLAACFMDALATGGYDATGYSLCYEYGMFKQMLSDGWQMEVPDNWLPGGRVWLNPREDDTFKVKFYGDYHEYWEDGKMKYTLEHAQEVEAIPNDMFISGAASDSVNKLRLWLAKDWEGFDMASFNSGDFTKAAQRTNSAEMITKVLYPADNIEEGKELRLKQQYLMVSASCQNIVRDQYAIFGTLDNFEKKTVIHINDTHPALCVPELMRIFMDDYGYDWDDAWKKVTGSISYTNHTVLAEALEKWNEGLVQSMLPRIFSIIQEINRRFREDMNENYFPGDWGKIDYMSPLGEQKVHMANLSVIGSHHVNGVSALHSDILKDDLFHDFYLWAPERFTNVTNGIAYRRWLCQSNPALAKLLDETIGPEYRLKYKKLQDFAKYKDDKTVQAEIDRIKRENKVRMCEMIKEKNGIDVDPDSLFIVQAKRLHEYKRQLLNALRIISRYQMLRNDPGIDMRPETYLFGAKAAPSYYLAKYVIQLIAKLADEINSDPVISQKLKVVFLENYSVSMAEKLMPAAEISEQISLAGKEASGTGNMKMMINGAITMGTLDGANVEIREAVGDENIFIFGQKTEEVVENLRNGYNARECYERNDLLRDAVDALDYGFGGQSFNNIKSYLLDPSYSIADPYMCLKDFDDYCKVHQEMQDVYEDRARWNSMSIVNIAEASRFAADRSIDDYARKIWFTKPIK